MKFRVGQKVRSLHDTGEGVIVALINAHTVEVDFGDDFPIDMNISDIIPVDSAESLYLGDGTEETLTSPTPSDPDVRKPMTLGLALMDISLVFSEAGNDRYKVSLANPEPPQMLFAVYRREKSQYFGLASGMLNTGEVKDLAVLSGAELSRSRSFFVQVVSFMPGKGHPHTPLISELDWKKDQLKMPPRYLEAIGEPGWAFSLRKNLEKKVYDDLSDSDFIRIAREDAPKADVHMEVDLHLEELVDFPDTVPPGDALQLQLDAVARALSDALVHHAASLILIHGIGAGKLKQEVHDMLKRTRHVKSFGPADARKYGNGATKVIFQ